MRTRLPASSTNDPADRNATPAACGRADAPAPAIANATASPAAAERQTRRVISKSLRRRGRCPASSDQEVRRIHPAQRLRRHPLGQQLARDRFEELEQLLAALVA